MKSEYNDGLKKFMMTPEQAKNQLINMGYEKLSDVPISNSDYLMALFLIAISSVPLDLAEIRDYARASMKVRV
jgi:hypothetical protein